MQLLYLVETRFVGSRGWIGVGDKNRAVNGVKYAFAQVSFRF